LQDVHKIDHEKIGRMPAKIANRLLHRGHIDGCDARVSLRGIEAILLIVFPAIFKAAEDCHSERCIADLECLHERLCGLRYVFACAKAAGACRIERGESIIEANLSLVERMVVGERIRDRTETTEGCRRLHRIAVVEIVFALQGTVTMQSERSLQVEYAVIYSLQKPAEICKAVGVAFFVRILAWPFLAYSSW